MRKLIEILVLGFALLSLVNVSNAREQRLQSGDVLLISLNCYLCALIERSTGAPFSHSALVLEKEGEFYAAQALGSVHLTSIESFLEMARPHSAVAHLRPRQFFGPQKLFETYELFAGRPFDRHYRWDDEKLYCSEFIAKFFQVLDPNALGPRPISYGEFDQLWRQTLGSRYNGGILGNSPADLLRNSFFSYIDDY